MTFMAGFNPLLVLIASFLNKKSYWKITAFDYFCGGLSIIGLVLLLVTKQGSLAISLAIASGAFAGIPTIIKAFKNPSSESWVAYFSGGISAIIVLLTLKEWSYANFGFPLYILTNCTILTLLIRFRVGQNLAPHKTA
jgi:hypothetical protein